MMAPRLCGIVWCLGVLQNLYCLRFCRSVSKVHDEWFADEEKVRRAVGLLERPVVDYPNAREVSKPYFTMFFEILVIA